MTTRYHQLTWSQWLNNIAGSPTIKEGQPSWGYPPLPRRYNHKTQHNDFKTSSSSSRSTRPPSYLYTLTSKIKSATPADLPRDISASCVQLNTPNTAFVKTEFLVGSVARWKIASFEMAPKKRLDTSRHHTFLIFQIKSLMTDVLIVKGESLILGQYNVQQWRKLLSNVPRGREIGNERGSKVREAKEAVAVAEARAKLRVVVDLPCSCIAERCCVIGKLYLLCFSQASQLIPVAFAQFFAIPFRIIRHPKLWLIWQFHFCTSHGFSHGFLHGFWKVLGIGVRHNSTDVWHHFWLWAGVRL